MLEGSRSEISTDHLVHFTNCCVVAFVAPDNDIPRRLLVACDVFARYFFSSGASRSASHRVATLKVE